VPSKRKKVETSPNLRFVKIEAIRHAKIEAGELEAESVDEEASERSKTLESYIVVGFNKEEEEEVDG